VAVATTLVEIGREELRQKVERGDDFVLVDALPTIAYAGAHLPGAISIPPERMETLIERKIPSLDAEVVVYCANPSCESSVQVAQRLLDLGYRNVRHYSGGKQDWRDAGLPLEGGRI
jgi:rhodanese-related sulfurtransferase